MKKIIYIFFTVSALFSVSSCGLFKTTDKAENTNEAVIVETNNSKSFPSSNLIVKEVYLISIDSSLGVGENAEALEIYNKYKPLHDAEMNEVISHTNVDLIKLPRYNSSGTAQVKQSLIWNFLCDLLLDAWNNDLVKEGLDPADLVIYNSGGIRSNISKGDITVGDVYKVVPFDNALVMIELDYATLLQWINRISNDNGWPISNSVDLIISDSKFVSMEINGVEIEEGKTYKVLTNDYLLQGGDGLTFLADNISVVNSGVVVRDVVINYLRDLQSKNITINTQIDGRIRDEN